MEKVIFKHSKGVTFLVFFVLMLVSSGVCYFFPPRIHAELWNMKSFCNISFSTALFAFPCVYLLTNVQRLKWLGLLVSFLDVIIVLYLVMWTHSAVYWSPWVVCLFNHIFVTWVCGDGDITEKYEDFLSVQVVFAYICGGICSFFLWGIFLFS